MGPKATTPPLAKAGLSADPTRDAVLRVARLLPAKPPVPVLAGIKISFLGDRVRFEAGDFLWAGFAEVATAAPAAATAEILVHGAMLARVIRRAPGEELTLTATATELVISAQRWTTRLLYLPVEDYLDWTAIYTGQAADEDDERIYGNSAETAKPVRPDARDRSLRAAPPGGPSMWKRPPFTRTPFEPGPYEAGDWVEYTDADDRVHVGQVWAPASTSLPGTLLVLTGDANQVRACEFVAENNGRTSRSFHVRDERPRSGDGRPRIFARQELRRTHQPPAQEPEARRTRTLAA